MSLSITKQERALLESLNSHGVRYIVVGLSSAILQEAPVVTQDIDLWIEHLGSESFQKAVNEVAGFYIPPGVAGQNPPMLGPDTFKVFDIVSHMHGLDDFSTEYSRSISATIDGVEIKILPLERIILSKETLNREKDKAVLPALRAALAIRNKSE